MKTTKEFFAEQPVLVKSNMGEAICKICKIHLFDERNNYVRLSKTKPEDIDRINHEKDCYYLTTIKPELDAIAAEAAMQQAPEPAERRYNVTIFSTPDPRVAIYCVNLAEHPETWSQGPELLACIDAVDAMQEESKREAEEAEEEEAQDTTSFPQLLAALFRKYHADMQALERRIAALETREKEHGTDR